jgi:hypothetical protein
MTSNSRSSSVLSQTSSQAGDHLTPTFVSKNKKQTPWPEVRKGTIPTERPPTSVSGLDFKGCWLSLHVLSTDLVGETLLLLLCLHLLWQKSGKVLSNCLGNGIVPTQPFPVNGCLCFFITLVFRRHATLYCTTYFTPNTVHIQRRQPG